MRFVRLEKKDNIAWIWLNSPETRNALTGSEMIKAVVAACSDINKDISIRAVVLTATDPSFSSGGDLNQMQEMFKIPANELRDWYRHGIQKLIRAVYDIEVPVIAAVNGPAIGAGCDLACVADIRIASERAEFAESFVKVGLIPGDGGAWLLQRVVGKSMAAELMFTGKKIDAQEAYKIGLVSQVVSHESLIEHASDMAKEISRNPRNVLLLSKRLIRDAESSDLSTTLENSAIIQSTLHNTEFHKEAVTAFLEKRKPVFSKESLQ